MVYELVTQYDKRKSFYNKAYVVIEDGIRMLFSYGTLVAEIYYSESVGKLIAEINDEAVCSMTSLRHTKEFLKQNGFKAETKSQIIRDYMKK